MRPLRIFTLLLTSICSCHPTDKKERGLIEDPSPKTEAKSTTLDKKSTFDYRNFQIEKGQLGEIRIGMTIDEAEKKFSGLGKRIGQATGFGFGGGSPAHLYYIDDQIVFALIPALNTDTLLFIVAADSGLTTSNGLNPRSTVQDITKIYPGIKVDQDIMNGWEVISDTTNNWDFVFMTEGDERVGEYPELEVPSEPVNIKIKSDWITIK